MPIKLTAIIVSLLIISGCGATIPTPSPADTSAPTAVESTPAPITTPDTAIPVPDTTESVKTTPTVPTPKVAIPNTPAPTPKPPVVVDTPQAGAPTKPVVNTPPAFTLAEVQAANNAQKCWSIINGQVYDLTKYIYQHKGGAQQILSICGRDGTSAFNNQHGDKQEIARYLQNMRLGALK